MFGSTTPGVSSKYPQLARLDELTLDEIGERASFRNARRAPPPLCWWSFVLALYWC